MKVSKHKIVNAKEQIQLNTEILWQTGNIQIKLED